MQQIKVKLSSSKLPFFFTLGFSILLLMHGNQSFAQCNSTIALKYTKELNAPQVDAVSFDYHPVFPGMSTALGATVQLKGLKKGNVYEIYTEQSTESWSYIGSATKYYPSYTADISVFPLITLTAETAIINNHVDLGTQWKGQDYATTGGIKRSNSVYYKAGEDGNININALNDNCYPVNTPYKIIVKCVYQAIYSFKECLTCPDYKKIIPIPAGFSSCKTTIIGGGGGSLDADIYLYTDNVLFNSLRDITTIGLQAIPFGPWKSIGDLLESALADGPSSVNTDGGGGGDCGVATIDVSQGGTMEITVGRKGDAGKWKNARTEWDEYNNAGTNIPPPPANIDYPKSHGSLVTYKTPSNVATDYYVDGGNVWIPEFISDFNYDPDLAVFEWDGYVSTTSILSPSNQFYSPPTGRFSTYNHGGLGSLGRDLGLGGLSYSGNGGGAASPLAPGGTPPDECTTMATEAPEYIIKNGGLAVDYHLVSLGGSSLIELSLGNLGLTDKYIGYGSGNLECGFDVTSNGVKGHFPGGGASGATISHPTKEAADDLNAGFEIAIDLADHIPFLNSVDFYNLQDAYHLTDGGEGAPGYVQLEFSPILPVQTITSISPTTLCRTDNEQTLTISGTNLDFPNHFIAVMVGTTAGTVVSKTNTSITITFTNIGRLNATEISVITLRGKASIPISFKAGIAPKFIGIQAKSESYCVGNNMNLSATASSEAFYGQPISYYTPDPDFYAHDTSWLAHIDLNTETNIEGFLAPSFTKSYTGKQHRHSERHIEVNRYFPVKANKSYTFNVKTASPLTSDYARSGYAPKHYFSAYAIWIDYNHDGEFSAAEYVGGGSDPNTTEQAIIGPSTDGTKNYTLSLNIPTSAYNGYTRMRVMTRQKSISNTVANANLNGSIHDFGLYIIGGTPKPPDGYIYSWSNIGSGNPVTVPIQAVASLYTVSVVSPNGCVAKKTEGFNAPLPVIVNITADPATIDPGTSSVLTPTSTSNNVSYTWVADPNLQYPLWGPPGVINVKDLTQTKTFTVTGTSYDGCVSDPTSITVTINSPKVIPGPTIMSCANGITAPLGGSFSGTATGAIWSDGGLGGVFTANDGSTPGSSTYDIPIGSTGSITLTLSSVGGIGTATATKKIILNTADDIVLQTTKTDGGGCVGTDFIFIDGTDLASVKWYQGRVLVKSGGTDYFPTEAGNFMVTATTQGACIVKSNIVSYRSAPNSLAIDPASPVCTGADETLSAFTTFTGIAGADFDSIYCLDLGSTIDGFTTGNAYIQGVEFNTISNYTGSDADSGPTWSPGYRDYSSSINTTVVAGTSYLLQVKCGNPSTGDVYIAWIDYNRDGLFDDATEKYNLTGGGLGVNALAQILIPTDAINGKTRMRVRINHLETAHSCGMSTEGETEDYSIYITGAVDQIHYVWSPSTYLTSTEGAVVSAKNIAADISYTITKAAYTGCTSSATLTVTTKSSPTINSLYTSVSEVCEGQGATVGIDIPATHSLPALNCLPVYTNGCSPDMNISYVEMGGDPHLWDWICQNNGYSDRMNFVLGDAYSTQSNTFNIITAYITAVHPIIYGAAWIDYDNNGIFEASEYIDLGVAIVQSGGYTWIGSYNVAANVSAGLHRVRIRVNTTAPFATGDACTAYPEGQGKDYLINVSHEIFTWSPSTFLSSSTGRKVTATNMTSSQTYTVTASNAATGCSSKDSISIKVNSVDVKVKQTMDRICDGGTTEMEAQIGADYCIPTLTSGCGFYDYITNVTYGGFVRNSSCDNLSGSNGYSFLGNTNVDFTAGVSIPLSVSLEGLKVGAAVWIDYNQNGVFEADELVLNAFTGISQATYSTNVIIPTSALNGDTRMRVRSLYAVDPSTLGPCAAAQYGETEDYTITIINGTNISYSYTWSPSTFLSANTGKTTTVAGINTPTTYTLQATNLVNGCVGQAVKSFVLNPNLDVNFTSDVICQGKSTSLNSNVADPEVTYTIPIITSGCSLGDEITNINLGSLFYNTACNMAPGLNGYSHLEDANIPDIAVGESNTLSIATSGQHGAAVWIDYNHDGSFGADELVLDGYSGANPASYNTSLVIPATSLNGKTRLRIRNKLTSNPADFGPTASFDRGETEDYTINITGGQEAYNYSWSPTNYLGETTGRHIVTNGIETPMHYTLEVTDKGTGCKGTYSDSIKFAPSPVITNLTAQPSAIVCLDSDVALSSIVSKAYIRYDIPVMTGGCGTGSEIVQVVFGSLNRSSSCDNLSGANAYSLIETPVTPIVANTATSISVSTVGRNGVAVWIDYNQNGEFENSELVMNGMTVSLLNTYSGSVTIPITALNGTTRMRVRSAHITDPANIGSDLKFTDGETEDYLITISNGTDVNYTYDWSLGNLTSLGTTNSYTAKKVNSPRTYLLNVTDANSACVATKSIELNVIPSIQISSSGASPSAVCLNGNATLSAVATPLTLNYCTPQITGSCSSSGYISNVTAGTLNRSSTCDTASGHDNYSLFESSIPTFTAGIPTSITISTVGDTTIGAAVWIDFNHNGSFENNELVLDSLGKSASSTYNKIMNVPASALNGNTRMRVRSQRMKNPIGVGGCGTSFTGETEDYVVLIAGATDNSFTYNWTPSTFLSSTTGSSVNAAGITATTVYTVTATNDHTGCLSSSNVIALLNPSPIATATASLSAVCAGANATLSTEVNSGASAHYTAPIMTTGCVGDMITQVTFGNLSRSSGCDNLSGSNGYSYFTDPIPPFIATSSHPLTVITGGDYEGVAVWIDYNQNGIFEASENIFHSYQVTNPATYTSSISIPLTALNGETHMRVRAVFGKDPFLADASTAGIHGETEDYKITITGATDPSYTHNWSPATYLSATTGTSVTATAITTPISYTIQTTNNLTNCVSETTVSVAVNPAITVDALINETRCDSYTLPALSVGDYFTGPGGTGTALFAGNNILSTQTIYVYGQTGVVPYCTDENSFLVTINPTVSASMSISSDALFNSICEGYTTTFTAVPVNTGVTAPSFQWKNGSTNVGTNSPTYVTSSLENLDAVQLIMTSDAASCVNNSPVTSNTVNTFVTAFPTVSTHPNVTVCDSYTLPVLSSGNYYTGSDGGGAVLNAGDKITSTQSIFIFGETQTLPNCTDQNLFTVTIENCSQLTLASCDITLNSLQDPINSEQVAGATNYRYWIQHAATGYSGVSVRNASDDLFRLSWISNGIQYGTTYTIRVSAYVSGAWTNYGAPCNITTPPCRLLPVHDGALITNTSQALYSFTVAGATDYKYWVKNGATGFDDVSVIGSASNYFRLSWFSSNVEQARTYEVRVSAKVDGIWQAYGPISHIITAVPETQLNSASCNAAIPSLSTALYCDAVVGASNYRYQISAAGFSSISVRGSSSTLFRLSWVTGTLMNTVYTIKVAAQINGLWGNYGPACTVNPTAQATQLSSGSCNTLVGTLSTALYCDQVAGATNYRYWVTADGFSKISYRGSSDNLFRLSWISGIQAGNTYTIRTSAYVSGVWTPYGIACEIATPNAMLIQTETIEIADDTPIWIEAYPNPTNLEFTLRSSHAGQFKVLNELGQLIRTIDMSAEANFEQKIEGLSAGIYYISGTIQEQILIKKVVVL